MICRRFFKILQTIYQSDRYKRILTKCKNIFPRIDRRKIHELKNVGILFIFLFLLVFIMRDLVAEIINKIWVIPIMSKMYENAFRYFLFVFLILLIYYLLSCKKERFKSKPRQYLVIWTSVFYLLCLLYSSKDEGLGWQYKSIIDGHQCIITYYTTLILLVPIIGELLLYKKRRKLQSKLEQKCSLIFEKPIEEESEDMYKRNIYCKVIAQKINNNFHREGSFVIGISGNWGAGKTSFLNLIKGPNKAKEIDIILDFKPWFSSSSSNIITDFFSQISKELFIYVPQARSKLNEYAELISDMKLDPVLDRGLKIVKWGLSESPGNKYDDISRILEKTKIKILIFIDDVDRLSKDEILEIFRLVRITANFPYLQFIIPFDRDYILNTIKIPNPEKYLRKIFNLEIVLPVIDSEIIREVLKRELNYYLTIEDTYKDCIIKFLMEYENGFPVERLIRTRRDVIRFTNSLIINIEAVASSQISRSLRDINILDLFKIELIRYAYPVYYDQLAQEPLSVLEISEGSYRYKKENTLLKEDSNDKSLKINKSEINGKGENLKPDEVLSKCMDNLFPQNFIENKNAISKIRSFDQYFWYRFDEKNISATETIIILLEKDEIVQRKILEKYYLVKKKGEVYNMVVSIISMSKDKSWRDEQSPNYYKNVSKFLFCAFNSEINELKKEIAKACSPIFNQSIYDDIDYYIEILQLWDRFLILNILEDNKIMNGFMFNDNLQAKLGRNITEKDSSKLKEFLYNSVNFIQMSNLLSFYVDPEKNYSSNLVIETSIIKDIQLSYFMQYAKKNKVDKNCTDLFLYCADVESGSRNFLWNRTASQKMRELVDIDPEGYLDVFIPKIEMYFLYPPFWKPIFDEKSEEVEKYLFEKNKDQYKGIKIARTVWNLYKNNDYNEIPLNNYPFANNNNDSIISQLGDFLNKMLDINKQIDSVIEEIKVNSHESNLISKNVLKDLRKELVSIPLQITLKGNLISKIDKFTFV